jgi:hypothetical protein
MDQAARRNIGGCSLMSYPSSWLSPFASGFAVILFFVFSLDAIALLKSLQSLT